MVRVARQPASTQAKYVTASMVTNPGNYNYDLSLETQALLASIVNPRGNVIIKPVVKLRRLKPEPEDLKQTVRKVTEVPSSRVRKEIHKVTNSLNGVLNGDVRNKNRAPTRNSARTKTKAELKSVEINGLESEPDDKAKKPSANSNNYQEPNTRVVPKRIIRTRKRGRRAPAVGAKTGLVQRVKPYLLKNKIYKLNKKLETIRGKRLSGKEQEGETEKEEETQVDNVEEGQGEAINSVSEDTHGAKDLQDSANSKDTVNIENSEEELGYECVRQRKPLVVKIRRKSEDNRAKRRSSRSLSDKSIKATSPKTSPEPIITQGEGSSSPNDKNSPGTPRGRRTITNETRKKSIALLKANRTQSHSPNEDRSLESNATSKTIPKRKSPNSKNSKTTPKSKDNPMNAAPEQPIQNGNHQDIELSQDTASTQNAEETTSETSCPQQFRRPKYITKKSHILKRLAPFTTTGSWTGSISDLSDKPASSDSSMPGTPEEASTQSIASTAETSMPEASTIEDNGDIGTKTAGRTLQKETELPTEVIDKLTNIAENSKDKNESAKDSDKSAENKNNGDTLDSPESLLESELEKSTMAILGTIIKESAKATNEEQELPCLPDSTTVSDDLQDDLDLHDDADSLDIPIFTASVAKHKHSKTAKANEMNAKKDVTHDSVSTCNVTESPSSKWKAIPMLVEERDKPGSKSQSVIKLIHRLSERISPRRSSPGSSGIQDNSNPDKQMNKTDATENETVVSSTSEHPDPQTDIIINCVTLEKKSNYLPATNTGPKDSQQKAKPVGVAKRKRGPRKRLVQAAQNDNAIVEQKKQVGNEGKIQTNSTATANDLKNQTGNTGAQSQSTTTSIKPQKSNQESVKSKKPSPRSGPLAKRRTSTRTSIVHKSVEEHRDTVPESIAKRRASKRISTGHKLVGEKMDTQSETSSLKDVRLIVEDCAKRPPKISLDMGYTLNLAPIVKTTVRDKSNDSINESEHSNNHDIATTTTNNVPETRARPKTKGKRNGKQTGQKVVDKGPEERPHSDEVKVKDVAPASNKDNPTPRRGRPRKRKAATQANKNITAQVDNAVNTMADEDIAVSETRPLRKPSERQAKTAETVQSKEAIVKPVKQAKDSARTSPRRSSPRGKANHSERGPDIKADKTVSPSPTRSSMRGKGTDTENETSKQISSEAIIKRTTRGSSRGKSVEQTSSKVAGQSTTSATDGTVSSTSKGPQKNSPRGRGSKKKTEKATKISIRKSPDNIIQRPKNTVEEIIDEHISDVDSEATEILDLETLNEKLDEVNVRNAVNDKDTGDLNKNVPGRSLRQTSGRRALSVEKARLASVSSADESRVRENKKTETRRGKARPAAEKPFDTRPVKESKKRDAQSISEDASPGRETRRTAAAGKSTTGSSPGRGRNKKAEEVEDVEEDRETDKSPVRKSRRLQSLPDVSPSSTRRKGAAKTPPATVEEVNKGKQPVRASKRVQDAEKGKQETKDKQETLPSIEPPRRTLRNRDKPPEKTIEKPVDETVNKETIPTKKTKLTEAKAGKGTKAKVARRGKAALNGEPTRRRGKAALTEVYIMEEEPETITAVHEETHHVKKKTIRDVTDICILHDGTLLLALTLKDDSYVMRRYADDMSLILWELPLTSPASGFEEIICEGISLLALSHHPPKDTAGVMKFRNMDEIELVEFTLILRAQDPSHFCKLPNGDMAYVDSGPKNCMIRYISCSMLPPKVDRTRPDVELHMQNNVSSVTCMQHNTQGELIIVAGNERICIYRTDTARLVSQIVGRIGGGLTPTSICCNLGPVIFTADTANQKILAMVYYGDSHSLRFNTDIVSNVEHGIGAPHTVAWDRKNSRLVVYHLLPAMISSYSMEYTWPDTISDT